MSFNQEFILQCKRLCVEYKISTSYSNTLKESFINHIKGQSSSLVRKALRGVDIKARPGDCIALIGHNGSGKSTLLKCLAGIIKPSEGSMFLGGNVAPLIELGAGFDPELTGRENVYLSSSLMGLLKSEVDAVIQSIIDFADLGEFFDLPVKSYSSGMYMRLAFACTTNISASIVLVDEILAVGDDTFQRKCLNKIEEVRSAGTTIVLVSHDLETVRSMSSYVYVLDEGKVLYEGHPHIAIDFYKDLLAQREMSKLPKALKLEKERRYRLTKSEIGVKGKVLKAEVGPVNHECLQSGHPWFLDVQIEMFEEEVANPVIGFAVEDKDGRRVFGGNTKIFSSKLISPWKQGKGFLSVRFSFTELSLASGEYSIVAAIHSFDLAETIDIRKGIVKFYVVDQMDKFNYDQDLLASHYLIDHLEINQTNG